LNEFLLATTRRIAYTYGEGVFSRKGLRRLAMVQATVRIPRMGRKKKRDNGDDAPGRSTAYTVYARIDPELGAAFEAYVKSLRPQPSNTATIEVFFEECLQARGFWPPPGKKEAK
jgi:hypothetical protein